jgi:hypothetical protein
VVANAQDVLSKVKVVNVKGQVMTEGIINYTNEDMDEASRGDDGDDSRDDPTWIDLYSGGGMGGGIDGNDTVREHTLLTSFEITD